MPSFDVVSKIDLQEVDNSVNTVLREIGNRYDFKSVKWSIELDKKEKNITIVGESDYCLEQIQSSLKASFVKRKLDPVALDFQKEEKASGNTLRQVVKIKEDEEFTVGSLALKFYKMRHPVLSYGVRATNGEKTFAYTGDTNTHENLLSIFDGADLVLADGAFLLKDWAENKPHLSVSHIAELTKKCGNRSIITHLSAKYTLDELIGEVGDVDCQIASEGKCYEI